jgi:hypothetical protein
MVGGIIGNLVTLVITDYYSFVIFIFVGYTFSMLLFVIFIPESPYFLLKSNDKINLEKFVCDVAKLNGVPEDKLPEMLETLDHLVQSNNKWIIF